MVEDQATQVARGADEEDIGECHLSFSTLKGVAWRTKTEERIGCPSRVRGFLHPGVPGMDGCSDAMGSHSSKSIESGGMVSLCTFPALFVSVVLFPAEPHPRNSDTPLLRGTLGM